MIEASHLVKKVNGFGLINDVSLKVARGELVGLFGPSGAGKTSLFRALTGLFLVDAGTLTIDGQPVTHLPMHERARRGLGYVPQEPSVFRSLTVEQNITLMLETLYPRGSARKAMLQRLLADLGLTHVRRSKTGTLSGGERRRCEIACGIALDPGYLLLDEPFAAVDPIGVSEIGALLRQICARGIGILLTDHNLHDALRLVDRAYVIADGRLLAEGSPADLATNQQVREQYLGEGFRF